MGEQDDQRPARLPLRRSPLLGETLSGFMFRLLGLNGPGCFDDAPGLARLELPNFHWGDAEIDALAAKVALPAAALVPLNPGYESSPDWRKSGTYVVCGHRMPANWLVMGPRRFCPECVALSGHHRAEWDVAPIQHCATHGIALAWSCPDCRTEASWRHGSVSACRCGQPFRRAARVPVPTSQAGLAPLLDGLFHSVPTEVPPRLRGLGFSDTVHVLAMFGQVVTGAGTGITPNARLMDTSRTLAAGLVAVQGGDGVLKGSIIDFLRTRVWPAGAMPVRPARGGQGGPALFSSWEGMLPPVWPNRTGPVTVWSAVLHLEALAMPATVALARVAREVLGIERRAAEPVPGEPPRDPPSIPMPLDLQPDLFRHAGADRRRSGPADFSRESPAAAEPCGREEFALRVADMLIVGCGAYEAAGVLESYAALAGSPRELDALVAPDGPARDAPGCGTMFSGRDVLALLRYGRWVWDRSLDPAGGDFSLQNFERGLASIVAAAGSPSQPGPGSGAGGAAAILASLVGSGVPAGGASAVLPGEPEPVVSSPAEGTGHVPPASGTRTA